MLGIDRNQQFASPIKLVLNYWDFRPTVLVQRLDALMAQGVQEVVSFVPWQVVEADISHSLFRFLQAAAERHIGVTLVVSPELGLAAPNSGIPRDLISKSECLAVHAGGGPVVSLAAPAMHAVPSLHSAEFQKRFQNYLGRVDQVIADVQKRGDRGVLDRVSLVLTGSFWKYYRAPQFSADGAFEAVAGDQSGSVAIQFRSRVEQRFSEAEFCDPTPASANRWKVKGLEAVNRRWFMQDAEDQFRQKNAQFFGRRSSVVPVQQVELHAPEVDPGFHYSSLLALASGGRADFSRLSALLDEFSLRRSAVQGAATLPWVHWTAVGGFATLLDAEKQFLILKSILLMASQGGGVLVDADEWLSLSEGFRRRADSLARSLAAGDYRLRQRAYYLNPHLWSSGGELWKELKGRLGSLCRMIASDDLLHGDQGMDADLLVLDPSNILTRTRLLRLLAWTRSGRVTALPRSILYSEAARQELSRVCNGSERMELHVGIPFELHVMGEGKLVIYDSHALEKSESSEVAQQFIQSILGLAAIKNPCVTGDARLEVVGLERRGGGRGIFVLNPSSRPIEADLLFPNEVRVGDLGEQLGRQGSSSVTGMEPVETMASQRFRLEAPPCGVLPMEVLDAQWENELERRQAARVMEETERSAHLAAEAELAGWSPEMQDMGASVWS